MAAHQAFSIASAVVPDLSAVLKIAIGPFGVAASPMLPLRVGVPTWIFWNDCMNVLGTTAYVLPEGTVTLAQSAAC